MHGNTQFIGQINLNTGISNWKVYRK